MPSNIDVKTNQNRATVNFKADQFQRLEMYTNAHWTHHVKIKIQDKEYSFSGSGEGKSLGHLKLPEAQPNSTVKLDLTLEHDRPGGGRQPTRVIAWPPVTEAHHNLLTIRGEDGADDDYNDIVLQLSGTDAMYG